MYLAYIDESGTPLLTDPEDYVLSAFIVNERKWRSVDRAINRIKQKYFPLVDPCEIELHTKDIVHRAYIFKSLGGNTKYDLLEECYRTIGGCGCTLISIVSRKAYVTKPRFDMELWGHRLLFERIEKFLEKQNPKEYGLMFIDSIAPKVDKNTRKKLLDFCLHGTRYIKGNELILEDPIFVLSHHRNMSQLADLIAFCVARKHKGATQMNITDAKFKEFYDIIYPSFDKDSSGNVDGCGLKIFP